MGTPTPTDVCWLSPRCRRMPQIGVRWPCQEPGVRCHRNARWRVAIAYGVDPRDLCTQHAAATCARPGRRVMALSLLAHAVGRVLARAGHGRSEAAGPGWAVRYCGDWAEVRWHSWAADAAGERPVWLAVYADVLAEAGYTTSVVDGHVHVTRGDS